MTMLKQNDSTKESYLRPESEVIIIELESVILNNSVIISATVHGFEDGGTSNITLFEK